MNAPIQNAVSHLPPAIMQTAMKLGIEPMRIEGSGAMRLRIDNKLSLAKKSHAIDAFKSVLSEYGLCLSRITTDTNSQSNWDSSLLMVKRDHLGQVVPLFNRQGTPMPDGPGTSGRHEKQAPTGGRQARMA